jgi:predicted PurR-regulated permease PerM
MALHKTDTEFFPNQTATTASTRSVLLGVVLLAVGILFVWYAANALLVIFAGILLAVFLNALSENLRRFVPVSALLATVIVMVSLVGLTVAGIWLLSPRLAQQAAALYENLPRAIDAIANGSQQSDAGSQLTKFIPQVEDIMRLSGGLMAPASWLFSTSIGLIARLVIILFVGVYVALDPQRYIRGLLLLAPLNKRARAKDVLYSIGTTLRRWTLARMLLMLANALLTTTGLWLLDIPFALTLGLIAGLLNFIPNLGPIIAGIPAILIGLLESPSQALYVAMLYLSLQAADGYIFTPLVQQKAVHLPPALTIAAQLLLGVLLGAWGLVLATPLLAASIVLIDKIYIEEHNGESPPSG